MSRRGTTMVEAIIFGAIASLVFVGIMGLLSRGSKFIELGRRSSSSATDLKIIMETLSEDAAELVAIEGGGKAYDSKNGGKLSFLVRSTRIEKAGAPPQGSSGLRRIEYRIEGTEELKDCIRKVTALGADPKGAGGTPSEHTLVKKGVVSLKVWPVAAIPRTGQPYGLALADADGFDKQGATMACLVVEVGIGAAAGETSTEKQTASTVVTKLWCRNRILELSRGALK